MTTIGTVVRPAVQPSSPAFARLAGCNLDRTHGRTVFGRASESTGPCIHRMSETVKRASIATSCELIALPGSCSHGPTRQRDLGATASLIKPCARQQSQSSKPP